MNPIRVRSSDMLSLHRPLTTQIGSEGEQAESRLTFHKLRDKDSVGDKHAPVFLPDLVWNTGSPKYLSCGVAKGLRCRPRRKQKAEEIVARHVALLYDQGCHTTCQTWGS